MAVVAVALGVTAEFVVTVRPVEPLDVPIPIVDTAPLARVAKADEEASLRVDREPPPAEIRAIASAFYAWNRAAAASPQAGLSPIDPEHEALVRELRSALGVARRNLGEDKTLAYLRDFRSFFTQLFMSKFEPDPRTRQLRPPTTSELGLVGGALVDVLKRNGWLDAENRPRVPMSILRARYKLHWTSTIFSLEDCDHTTPPVCYGLTTLPLDPLETRALLAFLIAHPVVRAEDVQGAGAFEAAVARRRLVYVDRLVALDAFAGGPTHTYLGDYPAELARGAMLYRLGNYDESVKALYVAKTKSPNDMRARNWFLAALQKTQPSE